ncbi:hypothetical protein J2S57_001467 [Kineosporia succinea]|uniref:Uncharacterized protein n=1 Tax=Kineosporia succinea TaxID=84632 RepID=A0ABT9NZ63_9ACTN|nr:hypothetical protein [Kineosporia succinea]
MAVERLRHSPAGLTLGSVTPTGTTAQRHRVPAGQIAGKQ